MSMIIRWCEGIALLPTCIAVLFVVGCSKNDEVMIDKPITTSGEVEPAWSPDGEYVAYTKEGEYEIWLFEIATEESEYLTDGSLPDWSPDGKEIVYVFNRDIHKIDVETREIKQLTTWGACFFPDWHPNGLKIAYRDSDGVRITDSTFASTKFIVQGDQPDWSPTGGNMGSALHFPH
jgi:Tol biopolymer transport system component